MHLAVMDSFVSNGDNDSQYSFNKLTAIKLLPLLLLYRVLDVYVAMLWWDWYLSVLVQYQLYLNLYLSVPVLTPKL
jgi:hypothetical protein